ncbi:MAG: SpoIIE family protein phosphatase [Chloroflexi bacterium]|nr:SpoIIE family protein phosphatase [Chloroflexota bacterium]MBI3339752.1 SpoIIE family protein phosphatase [Chloroflexota bacterium]
MDESVFLKIPLFADVPSSELIAMVRELPIRVYEPGEYLFHDGDPGEHLYVVMDGFLEIVLAADTPDELLLRVCGPGEYVGEMGLILPDGKRTASVRAKDKCHTWVLSRAKFTQVLQQWPVIAYSMVNILSERLDATNDSTFRDLTEKNHQLQKAYNDLKAAQELLIEKERLERELKVAADIQLSILPDVLPVVEGFDFGARILPARQVGGDFYDVFLVGEPQLGVVIGDVADKGVPSALFMARTHALVMAEADTRDITPGEVMRLVNNHITRLEKSAQFVTALYGLLDIQTGKFSYARAGHEPPLILNPDGTVERIPHSPGMSLGLWDKITLDERVVSLAPGSMLLLYTDGMTDCRNPDGVAFGLERIKATLRGLVGLSAQDVCDRLLDSLLSYQNGAKQDDDVTLVAIRAT